MEPVGAWEATEALEAVGLEERELWEEDEDDDKEDEEEVAGLQNEHWVWSVKTFAAPPTMSQPGKAKRSWNCKHWFCEQQ